MTHRSARTTTLLATIEAVATSRRIVCACAVKLAQLETALVERWKAEQTRDAIRHAAEWSAYS